MRALTAGPPTAASFFDTFAAQSFGFWPDADSDVVSEAMSSPLAVEKVFTVITPVQTNSPLAAFRPESMMTDVPSMKKSAFASLRAKPTYFARSALCCICSMVTGLFWKYLLLKRSLSSTFRS